MVKMVGLNFDHSGCPFCEMLKETYAPAFVRTAETCMEDMEEADCEDPEIVWEMATDADRAVTFGHLTEAQYKVFLGLNDKDKLMIQEEFNKLMGFGG